MFIANNSELKLRNIYIYKIPSLNNYYIDVLRYICYCVCYRFSLFHYFIIPLIFSAFSLIFSENEYINTKKPKEIPKKSSLFLRYSLILIIVIALIECFNLCCFKKRNPQKNHISYLKIINRFLKNAKNAPFEPLLDRNKPILDVSSVCESESLDQGRSYYQYNINISFCFFSRSSSYSGDGGVIYTNGGFYTMNVNNSMFYNCVCSNYGGAIWFSSTNSYLRMICVYRCSAFYGHYANLQVTQVNQIEYLSFSYCSHTTTGSYSICLLYGNQRVDNMNSSMNNAAGGSGISIYSPSSFTSSYCSFSNNKVSGSRCIEFSSYSGTISMSYANIVHNNSPSADGVVYAQGGGSRKMICCIFQNNQNYLLCLYSGSLEVLHSFIYHTGTLSTSASISTNNISFTNRMTYQIQFFNSRHCNADNTLPQRTLNQSPIRSLGETIGRTLQITQRMTYDRTIDQSIKETPKVTIYITFRDNMFNNQMAIMREIVYLYQLIIAFE